MANAPLRALHGAQFRVRGASSKGERIPSAVVLKKLAMSKQRALTSLVVSSSLLALTLPAQAAAPEFVDATGFDKSRSHNYAAPYKESRGGWGLDYRGMSNHDPAKSRVRRLTDKEQLAFIAPTKDPQAQAQAYINHHARALGIEDFKSGHLEVVASHKLSDGATIIQLRQRVDGIEVFGPQLSLLIDRSGKLVTVSGSVHTQLRVLRGRTRAFARSNESVMRDVVGAKLTRSIKGWSSRKDNGYVVYDSNKSSRAAGLAGSVRTKPLLIPTGQGLEAAYFVEYAQSGEHGEEGMMVVARASDSGVIYRKGLTHADSFKYRVWSRDDARKTPLDNPIVDVTPHPTGKPDTDKPGDPFPSILVDMEGFNTNPEGKPDPWLATGATESSGNNVDAYTDRDHGKDADDKEVNDGFTEGDVRAKVSAPATFDWAYDLDEEPGATEAQKMAAVTQVFYTNNWLHDYWYDLGWDEKSGNAQKSNYGRGGREGDPLLAEAQDQADTGARNNASMTTYAEGKSPRMQMYLWTAQDKVRTISTNPVISGFKDQTESANYGLQDFNITGEAVLVSDPEAPVNDGCQAVADPSTVQGKIVLVKMGYEPGETPTCKSIQRAALLQAAGAKGMIFIDSTDRVPKLGGDWPEEVTLPALSLNKTNGELLLAEMQNGPVQVTMERDKAAELDGSIDNQVVAHEWGHYTHLRLVSCGGTGCFGMSEGWADFFALHMSLKEGDDFNGVYPLAVYASSGGLVDPFYFGLRRYPYSLDKKINPLMFNHIADGEALPSPDDIPQKLSGQPNSEVHNAGEVWAQLLFAVERELHEVNKTKDKPLSWDGVHRLMGEYLIAGMKLTPPQPTWTEQRDAIMAVARARDPKDFAAMARGFSSRGMGTCAVSPPADSKDNVGAVANEDISGLMTFQGWSLDDSQSSCDKDGYLDVNERGNLKVSMRNVGMDLLKATTVELKSLDEALVVDSTGPVPIKDLAIDEENILDVPVRLIKAPAGRTLPLQIILRNEGSCLKTIEVNIKPRVDIDEVAESTDLETFESNRGLWTTVKDLEGPQDTWSWISETPDVEANFMWHGRDLAVESDSSLVSPSFAAKADEDFIVEFQHAYAFESSEHEDNLVHWDGALIEYTVDDGKTWLDLDKAAVNPEYTGVIAVVEKSKNPLTGRKGYVGTSAGYPAKSMVRLNFGRNVAGKTVKLRFRIGTDAASGAPGWLIDDLRVTGTEKKPFTKVVPDACDGPAQENTTGTGTGTAGTESGGVGSTGGVDTTGTAGGPGGGGANNNNNNDGGCGCETQSGQSGFLASFALLALGLFRRRKDQGVSGS